MWRLQKNWNDVFEMIEREMCGLGGSGYEIDYKTTELVVEQSQDETSRGGL